MLASRPPALVPAQLPVRWEHHRKVVHLRSGSLSALRRGPHPSDTSNSVYPAVTATRGCPCAQGLFRAREVSHPDGLAKAVPVEVVKRGDVVPTDDPHPRLASPLPVINHATALQSRASLSSRPCLRALPRAPPTRPGARPTACPAPPCLRPSTTKTAAHLRHARQRRTQLLPRDTPHGAPSHGRRSPVPPPTHGRAAQPNSTPGRPVESHRGHRGCRAATASGADTTER